MNAECPSPAGTRNIKPMMTPSTMHRNMRKSLNGLTPRMELSASKNIPAPTPKMMAKMPAGIFASKLRIWASYPVMSRGNGAGFCWSMGSGGRSLIAAGTPVSSGSSACPCAGDAFRRGRATSPMTRSSSVTSNRSQITSSLSISGYAFSLSHLLMAWRETPRSIANCSCVMFRCARRYCRLVLKLLIILSLCSSRSHSKKEPWPHYATQRDDPSTILWLHHTTQPQFGTQLMVASATFQRFHTYSTIGAHTNPFHDVSAKPYTKTDVTGNQYS